MNSLVLFGIIALACVAAAEEQYTSKFDNTNVDEILGNKRLLLSYVNCGLDVAPCTPEGKELKAHIKEALENHCAKCTDTQKVFVKKVIEHLINMEAELWAKLVEKYDPDMKYSKLYEDELKEAKH